MPGPRATEAERKEQILQAAVRAAATEGLESVSTRKVAAEAGLSHGLVFFHFRTRQALLVALLDWLVDQMAIPAIGDDVLRLRSPLERLLTVLRREIARVLADRRRVELFFAFWVMGMHQPDVRQRIRQALERYRALFRPMAEELIASEPRRFAGTTADSIAAIVVSVVEGCAVQAVIAPEDLDPDQYIATATTLVSELAAAH